MSGTSTVIQYFLSSQFFLSLVISVALIPILRRMAILFDLVDHPGGRKQHTSIVPLVGGPAIFLTLAISTLIWGIPKGFEGMAIATCGIFIIGLLDDRYDISAKFRLVAQASLVAGALTWDNNWISSFTVTDEWVLSFGAFQYPLTVFAIMGIMNAINMLDGLDGLSSGVVLIILGFLIGISSISHIETNSMVAICLFGAVLGFWLYNYRFSWRKKASVFMGDSGTTILGFILPYLAIKVSIVSPEHAPKSLLLWLFAIPIWDICAVVIKRLRDGLSPLQAGRDHIHHVLMRAGLSVRQSLHLIYLLTMATIAFGLSIQYFKLTQIETLISFLIFMVVYLGRVGSLTRKPRAEIYDFEKFGERRDPRFTEDSTVVEISRLKTLS